MTDKHPLDVLVGEHEKRRYATEFRPHLWSTSIPRNAFLRIAPQVYVSSPEFVFVQLASLFSLVELAQIGNELCGGYYLLASSGFCQRPEKSSITTRRRLESFIARAPEARGAQKARRALAWVTDHCNSPMETNALLALCLPKRFRGWSLRMPVVNKSVDVGKRMERYVGGSKYTPDFLWERKVGDKILRIAGEYDSHEYHDEEGAAEHTRIRRNDMKSMGYLVTSINKSQMADANQLQYPARQIARDLGVYRPVPTEEFLQEQNELLGLLSREAFR